MKKTIVRGEKYSLPFSRGILTRSINVIGLRPKKAYKIATDVQNYLKENKIKEISRDKLRKLTYNVIKEYSGEEKAEKFLKFRAIKTFEKPLVVLIGGPTGSGKSTISVELAHRLEITTVITTDIIREVMRNVVSRKIMPYLHQSSYLSWKKLDIDAESNPVILAFKQQAARVNVGIKGIIERAIRERSSVIINGVHILPSLIDSKDFPNTNIMLFFTYIDDAKTHKQRFYYREESGEVRKADRYIENFDHIRKIQDYVIKQANKKGIPCINNIDSEKATQEIVNHIIQRVK